MPEAAIDTLKILNFTAYALDEYKILACYLVFLVFCVVKLLSKHSTKTLIKNDNESNYDREDNRMNHDISFPFPISAPIPAQASFTDKNRLSLLRSSDDEPDSEHQTHHHYHMHHHHLNQTVSEKGKTI